MDIAPAPELCRSATVARFCEGCPPGGRFFLANRNFDAAAGVPASKVPNAEVVTLLDRA